MFDIHIVLVNYHTKDEVMRALGSIFNDIRDCPYAARVTVVDNSQNRDGLKGALAYFFPSAAYVDAGGNIGFGRGNNLGFQSALARYYFALNPDTEFLDDSRTVEKIVKFMDEHPKIGCIGPKLIYADGNLQYSCHRFDWPSILIKPLKHIGWDKKSRWVKKYTDRLLMKDCEHNEAQPVDWVLGASLIARAEAAKQVGWFDERYFMYFEDCDWCQTFWEHGWPVYYVPHIVIRHEYSRESAEVPGIFSALFKNKVARVHLWSWLKYLWKWRGKHKYYVKLS